jgi:KDO2-lipid IV(A) lauroyltransferase
MWFLAIDRPLKHKVVLIYKALSSAFFENKLKSIRKSFGTEPVEMKSFSSFLEKQKAPIAVIFGADQSHSNAKKSFWTTFLNQETGVVFGPEKFAVSRNAAVVFCQIQKKKRGYYAFKYSLLHSGDDATTYGDITKKHVRFLEEVIKKEPQGWLWTHKRWKRKRPADMPLH